MANKFIKGIVKFFKYYFAFYFLVGALGMILFVSQDGFPITFFMFIIFYGIAVLILKFRTVKNLIQKRNSNEYHENLSRYKNKLIIFSICIAICFILSYQYEVGRYGLATVITGFYIVGSVILLKNSKKKIKSKSTSAFTSVKQKQYNPIGGVLNVYLKQQGLPAGIEKEGFFDFFLCRDKIVILSEPYEIIMNKDNLKDIYFQSVIGEREIFESTTDNGEAYNYNLIIKYIDKDNFIREYIFTGNDNSKDYNGTRNFCKEVRKEFFGEEELNNNQIIL